MPQRREGSYWELIPNLALPQWGKLKLALDGRGKAANPSYVTCVQSGGPAGNAQSIPWVLLDIDEVPSLSLQSCLSVLDSWLSNSEISIFFFNYGVISFKMNLADDLTDVWKTGTVRLCTIPVKCGQLVEQGVLFPKSKQHLSERWFW